MAPGEGDSLVWDTSPLPQRDQSRSYAVISFRYLDAYS
jgi:hypothetical protein